MFVCVYAILLNVIALVIASLFEAYLYSLDLFFFILFHITIEGHVSCWLGSFEVVSDIVFY